MNSREITHLIIGIIILSLVVGFSSLIKQNYSLFGTLAIFSFVIIAINVLSKKLIAAKLDAGVEHSLWKMSRYGFIRHWKTAKPIHMGVILPLVLTAVSLGLLKIMTIFTYETTALKRRAARRHGYYSFTEMTDFHNALVGAGGIIAILLLSLVSYFIPGLETLARLSAYYAFWNMVPFSKLDGAQIFYGSRPVYYVVGIITLIFATYALFLI